MDKYAVMLDVDQVGFLFERAAHQHDTEAMAYFEAIRKLMVLDALEKFDRENSN